MFRRSFPPGYLEPVIQSSRGLDVHLYVAHLIPHFALIILHDKLSDFNSPNCLSVQKATEAARAILGLIYALCSTSYDITRLAPICADVWGRAASFLIRVLKYQVASEQHEEALTTYSEIKTVKYALDRMAERIPVGLRFSQMIDDEIQANGARCQRSISKQTAYSSRPPTPDTQTTTGPALNSTYYQTMWQDLQTTLSMRDVNTLQDSQIPASSRTNEPSEEFSGGQVQTTNMSQWLELDAFLSSSN
ncbi:hypothetical protein BDV93DRAFT_518588 [Ceratobasidium sp. AG-I]|nr:hypothetical protein BDV93DRAFT_518588 [Ceratobasidium sp. AG-I]